MNHFLWEICCDVLICCSDSFLSFWIKLTAPLLRECWPSAHHILGTLAAFLKLNEVKDCPQRSEMNSDLLTLNSTYSFSICCHASSITHIMLWLGHLFLMMLCSLLLILPGAPLEHIQSPYLQYPTEFQTKHELCVFTGIHRGSVSLTRIGIRRPTLVF